MRAAGPCQEEFLGYLISVSNIVFFTVCFSDWLQTKPDCYIVTAAGVAHASDWN